MDHRPAVLAGAAVILLAYLLASRITPAGSQSLVLRTQAIEIVDAAGRRRITLDAVGGRPAVWLYDSNNRRRIGLAIGLGDVPEVTLTDHTGRPRLLLRTDAERAVEVGLTDAFGRPRVGLWVDYRNDPGLWMYDRLARARIGLKVIAGDPHVWLFEHPTGRISFSAP